MEMINEKKRTLRKKIKDIKHDLSSDYVKLSSSQITNKIVKMESFKKAKIVMCYLSFDNEVDTSSLIKACQKLDKKIVVPIIIKNDNGTTYMEGSEIMDFENDLAPGVMGIWEPKVEFQRIINPSLIDFIVVPGLAFDIHGNRLGYGGGYYDYFLKRTSPDCAKVAITFSKQIVDLIPIENHDIPLKNILTEKGFIIIR